MPHKCPNCRTIVQPYQKYCRKCGTLVNKALLPGTEMAPEKKKKRIIAVIGASILVLGLIGLSAIFVPRILQEREGNGSETAENTEMPEPTPLPTEEPSPERDPTPEPTPEPTDEPEDVTDWNYIADQYYKIYLSYLDFINAEGDTSKLINVDPEQVNRFADNYKTKNAGNTFTNQIFDFDVTESALMKKGDGSFEADCYVHVANKDIEIKSGKEMVNDVTIHAKLRYDSEKSVWILKSQAGESFSYAGHTMIHCGSGDQETPKTPSTKSNDNESKIIGTLVPNVSNLRRRSGHSTSATILANPRYVNKGQTYEVYEVFGPDYQGLTWYRIDTDVWIANNSKNQFLKYTSY